MSEAGRLLPMAGADRPAETERLFERVAIVGLGVIGGSVAMAVKQAWPSALVLGVDSSSVVEQAIRLHAIDVGADDLFVVGGANLVVLAAPEDVNASVLRKLPEYIPGDCLVTDVGTFKRDVTEAAAAMLQRLTFIGGSPRVVAARAGIASARPDLFVGCDWILTPIDPAPPELERLVSFVRALGAAPRVMGADECDRLRAMEDRQPEEME